MTIKESIDRGPLKRDRQVLPTNWGFDSEHRQMLLDEGNRILTDAGIHDLLEQLSGVLQDGGEPRVERELDGRFIDDGTVQVTLKWGFKEFDKLTEDCKAVVIKARVLNGDLIIRGEEAELLPQSVWEYSRREVLEDAVIRAYRNPVKMSQSRSHLRF